MSIAVIRSLFLKSEQFFLFVSYRKTQHRALVVIKVNLGNTYKLAIFIFLGKFLTTSNPLNPPKMTQICAKMHIFINVSLYADDEA